MHLHAAVSVELDGRGQAGDLLVVLGLNVRENSILSGRDLLGELDVLGQGELALLKRAFEVDVLDLAAEVGILPDDGDQAVLDLQVHLGAIFDVFGEVTASDDAESLAAVFFYLAHVYVGGAATQILTPWVGWGSGRRS